MINKTMNATDDDLIRSVATGDDYAFKALVDRYQRQILNLTFRYIGNRSEAEDLTQEVFFRVWKSARHYEPKARFTTWLYRIAINLCINRRRSLRIRKWFTVSESDPQSRASDEIRTANWADSPATPEKNLIQSERIQQVKKAINGLPSSQRLATILRIYDELSYKEISEILSCSVPAVDALLIRAKKNLRKKLSLKK